jgi:hypothetical protein
MTYCRRPVAEERTPSICCLVVVFWVMAWAASPPLWAQDGHPGAEGLLDGLFLLKNTKTSRISSYDTSGANLDWIVIGPGETKTLAEIPGAGVIRRFYFAPLAADRMRYRKVILRMYWDGGKEPCVEVPLGDFFGSGLGTLRYFKSLVVNVNPGFSEWDFDAMVSYFPMPFANGARVTLENDGNVPDLRLWYHIDYEQYPDGQLPSNAGRLHAQWRHVVRPPVREGNPKNTTLGNVNVKNTTGEDNFLILDAEGQGSYVGLFLTVDNTAGGWYGEGDDMIFVDGAKWPPTFPGTGHEEIFNSGCCPDKEFWGPYTGFYLIENYKANFGGKNQMYRFYLNDPVHFQKSIRVTVEHGHANNFDNDYTSTAFWYQKDPHKTFPLMPKALDRLPGWPEGVAEALQLESKLGLELLTMLEAGKTKFSAADGKLLQELTKARSQEFRELRYQDFIRDVKAMEPIVSRYRSGPSNK